MQEVTLCLFVDKGKILLGMKKRRFGTGWFDIKDIPFDAMWPDDKHWLPMVLAGKKVEGHFNLINEGANVNGFNIREV